MAPESEVLAHHFADLEQQHEAASLGMWVFLATELMFFGGLFTAYTVYRYQYPEEFAAASARLNLAYGGFNTVVLLTSSLTMALAVYSARVGLRNWLVGYLIATAVLGAAFLVIKGFEYHADFTEHLAPGIDFDETAWEKPNGVKLFLVLYYLMTGVHAIHLLIGIVIMSVLTLLASRNHYSPAHYAPVEIGGLYWHFVDVIWSILLLPLLYMVGVR